MIVPNDVYRSFVETGTKWAEANFEWQQLDDQTKSVLAAIFVEIKKAEGGSAAEITQMALSCATYRDHLKEVAVAKRDALVAKVKYEAVQALFQAQRTAESSHRAASGSAT